MLQITIPSTELYDEKRNIFIQIKEQKIRLEHSLVSISKWESKWHKPFLSEDIKTNDEMVDYIRCMTITQNVDPNSYYCIPKNVMKEISNYIDDSRSATVFYDKEPLVKKKQRITSEKIYFWMVINNIPFECQTWHLNRLMNLIHYCNSVNQTPKKRSKQEIAREYARENAIRRKQWNTRG